VLHDDSSNKAYFVVAGLKIHTGATRQPVPGSLWPHARCDIRSD